MSKFDAERRALERAIAGLSDLIAETVDYQPCVDIGISNVMSSEDVDSGVRTVLIDTMSEIMVHRNAVIAGRAKMIHRLDILREQLAKIPK